MLMLMPTTAPLATMVWDTPTTDSMDSDPMLPLPMATGLMAMPPPTPMVPAGILARGLLRLRLSLRPMLMLTTAPLATTVLDTPTTDSMDTGPMPPPLPTAMALGLMAMPAPTPMVPTGISARGLLRLRLSPRLMLMLTTTALLATLVWDTPTTDTMDTGPMLPLPTPGLLATPPPTPTTMVPTTISARGLLMLSLRPMLMLMPTTAPLATLVWDTPTTDTTDSGPMLPLPTPGL